LKQIYGVTTYIIPDKRKQLKQIKPELMAFFLLKLILQTMWKLWFYKVIFT